MWIWFLLANPELAVRPRNLINRAAAAGKLRISVISLWETALLASGGRVVLGQPLAQWIMAAISAPGLSVEPLVSQVDVEAYSLPDAFHRDAAARLIVATARVVNATLMTRDQRILDYASHGHLTAIAA